MPIYMIFLKENVQINLMIPFYESSSHIELWMIDMESSDPRDKSCIICLF